MGFIWFNCCGYTWINDDPSQPATTSGSDAGPVPQLIRQENIGPGWIPRGATGPSLQLPSCDQGDHSVKRHGYPAVAEVAHS